VTELPPPGPHGGDAKRIALALGLDPASVVDLSASMNPFAPDITALAADILRRDPLALARYPDTSSAVDVLARAIDVDPASLVLTNGGAEAIALVAAETGAGHVVDPEFSLYRRHLPKVEPTAPRWRSNPSNPLGELAAPHETAGVWDEAFYPLAAGAWTRGDAASWRLGSLTKLWSCPGLRLGYVIAPDAASAGRIRERQPRWAVNGLALASLPELVARTRLTAWADAIARLRVDFSRRLRQLGYAARPTAANWLLVHDVGLRERLAPRGVVIRDCTSYGLPGVYRVALPRPEEADRVVDAFAAVAPR
jgi:histidinol-phosphate/aromatic aminotransferase/cobyric acid decarboxylase-like protein